MNYAETKVAMDARRAQIATLQKEMRELQGASSSRKRWPTTS